MPCLQASTLSLLLLDIRTKTMPGQAVGQLAGSACDRK